MSKFPKKIAQELFKRLKLHPSLEVEFVNQLDLFVENFSTQNSQAGLPEKPLRSFEPYRDKIVDYLRAPDGFGPWFLAGQLSRPLIREKSLAAYTALNNYLRKHQLPPDIVIPKRDEVIARRNDNLVVSGDVRVQARVADRRARMLKRLAQQSYQN